MLLVAAGLLTHSFIKLSTVDKGYEPGNVLAFQLLFPDQYSIARKAETIEALLASLRRLPSVKAAGFALVAEHRFLPDQYFLVFQPAP